jgi:hypothetical protein
MVIIMAIPTATSAAATAITNMAKICPVRNNGVMYLENATRDIFTAFIIISMHMRMTTALRFEMTPINPIQKSTADRTR